MDDAKREKLGEVIRFGIVGGLATVLQYVIYLAMMLALAHFIPNMATTVWLPPPTPSLHREFHLQFHRQYPLYLQGKGECQARSRIHPLPHRQLLDADPLPQPLRRLGSSQTAGYDTHPLHLHPGKLPSGKVLPEEIRGFKNTIKERYEKDIRYF